MKHQKYLQSIYICPPSNLRKIYLPIFANETEMQIEEDKGNSLANQRRALLVNQESSNSSQNRFVEQLKKEENILYSLQILVQDYISTLQSQFPYLCSKANSTGAHKECLFCLKKRMYQFLHNLKEGKENGGEIVDNPVFIFYSFSDWLITSILPGYLLEFSKQTTLHSEVEIEIVTTVIEILVYINATTSLLVVILNCLKFLAKFVTTHRSLPHLHFKLLNLIVNYSLSNYYMFIYTGHKSVIDLYSQLLTSLYSLQTKEMEYEYAIMIVKNGMNYLSTKFSLKIDSSTQKNMDSRDPIKFLEEEVNVLIQRKRKELGEEVANKIQSIWNTSKISNSDPLSTNRERMILLLSNSISSFSHIFNQPTNACSSIFLFLSDACNSFIRSLYYIDINPDSPRKELASLLLQIYHRSTTSQLHVETRHFKKTEESNNFGVILAITVFLLHKQIFSIEDLLLSPSFSFISSPDQQPHFLPMNTFLFSFLLLGYHTSPSIAQLLLPHHIHSSATNEETISLPFSLVLSPALHLQFIQKFLIPIILQSPENHQLKNLATSPLISLLCQINIPDIFSEAQSMEKSSNLNTLTKTALASLIEIIGTKMDISDSSTINIELILHKLDKWNVSKCWLEIQSYIQSIPKDSFKESSKSIIHSILFAFLSTFNQDKNNNISNTPLVSPSISDYFTLITMLDSRLKELLIDEITQLLQQQIQVFKEKEKSSIGETTNSISSLLNNATSLELILPLLSSLASDDQRHNLAHSLISQLEILFEYSASCRDTESALNLSLDQFLDFQNAVQIRTTLLSHILPRAARGSIHAERALLISSGTKSLLKHLSLLSSSFFSTSNLFYSLIGTLNDILYCVQTENVESDKEKQVQRLKLPKVCLVDLCNVSVFHFRIHFPF